MQVSLDAHTESLSASCTAAVAVIDRTWGHPSSHCGQTFNILTDSYRDRPKLCMIHVPTQSLSDSKSRADGSTVTIDL